jgi:tripartite ATP-independent transporter DctM subunit
MMSSEAIGLLGFVAVVLMILLRIPIGVAMALCGLVGTWIIGGFDMLAYTIGTAPYNAVSSYSLSVLPLFIIMGIVASNTDISRKIFLGANAGFGKMRGGLALATIGASAGFGAICGSSLATSATMAKVALPEMRRYGYDMRLASAAVAAGGTLGVMIPPSVALALYGLLTQTSIGSLYAAGILPGLLGIVLYCVAIWWTVLRDRSSAPVSDAGTILDRVKSVLSIWDVALLFLVVIGGMFLGFFSPTEAAAVGVIGAFVVALMRRSINLRNFVRILQESASTMGLIFLILIGATIFGFFVDLSGLPRTTVAFVAELDVTPMTVLVVIIIAYVLMGCILDSISMMLLTLPFIFPLVKDLGFDPVWFGILMVTAIEIGLITPPLGMNLFIVRAADPGLTMGTIVRGVLPFVVADLGRLALLVLFPAISLVLIS